ncbi:hypothetical protein FKM82_010943 [Ascaphus truei]
MTTARTLTDRDSQGYTSGVSAKRRTLQNKCKEEPVKLDELRTVSINKKNQRLQNSGEQIMFDLGHNVWILCGNLKIILWIYLKETIMLFVDLKENVLLLALLNHLLVIAELK